MYALLEKVGKSRNEVLQTSVLDLSDKRIGPSDCEALAELLLLCAGLVELKYADPNGAHSLSLLYTFASFPQPLVRQPCRTRAEVLS